VRRLHEPVSLPFDSGPIPPPRCGVCGGWLQRPVPPPDARVTYVVQRQRWVKIGMTGNLRERLNVLSRSTEGCLTVHPYGMTWTAPLHLRAVIDGDVEHELHERFADCHANGEWFEFDPIGVTMAPKVAIDRLRAWLWPHFRHCQATLPPWAAKAYVGEIGEAEWEAMQ
jgi:hypothetical protein